MRQIEIKHVVVIANVYEYSRKQVCNCPLCLGGQKYTVDTYVNVSIIFTDRLLLYFLLAIL